MYSFINCTCHHILLESRKGRKEWECLDHVEWMKHDTCGGLSEMLNHNEWLTLLLWAYVWMCTKLQTQWHVHCCHKWQNSVCESLLNSQWCNTVNISTVVMLGFWLCQFNRRPLSWGLCLLSSAKFSVWLFEFDIVCSLG